MSILKKTNRGFSLVEILVAMGIFSIIIFSIIELFVVSLEAQSIGRDKTKALYLTSEYIEGLKNIKSSNWNLLGNGRFIITKNPSNNLVLTATASAETVDNFSRYLIISDAYRDTTGKLVESGGNIDPSTKKITLTTNWTGLHGSSNTVNIYLTRYTDNLIWKQTTISDFNQGIMDFTKIVSPTIQDGEVQLIGGCPSGSPQSLIYDDQLRNGWRKDCSGLPFWQWLTCILLNFFDNNNTIATNNTSPTYNNSPDSMKITINPGGWSWVGINNFNATCTVGFKNLHFYAYNPNSQPLTFYVTAVYNNWNRRQVTIPPGGWTEVSLDYKDINNSYETSLQYLYFSLNSPSQKTIFYIDQMELTGGVGGFFSTGTYTSPVFDAGHGVCFNRISYSASLPANTGIGFQTAVSDNINGPWTFYGPSGTTMPNDLYKTQAGEGISLGNNIGRFIKFMSFLNSTDGKSSPVLNDVTINYSP